MRPDGARCGLTCRSGAARMAGHGLTWPRACGRWLPGWLPEISLAELMLEAQGAGTGPPDASPASELTRSSHRPVPGDDSPHRDLRVSQGLGSTLDAS